MVRTSRLSLPLPYRVPGLCGGAAPPRSALAPVTFLGFDPFTSQIIPMVIRTTGNKWGSKPREPPNNPNTIPTKAPTTPTTMPTAAPISPMIMPMLPCLLSSVNRLVPVMVRLLGLSLAPDTCLTAPWPREYCWVLRWLLGLGRANRSWRVWAHPAAAATAGSRPQSEGWARTC